MSAYEKPQSADLLDFHTTGALHDPSAYGAYAQPPYAPQLVYSTGLTGLPGQDTDHLHYVGSSEYSPQQPFEEDRPSTMDPRIRHPPEITSYTPQEGHQGCTVYVYLSTLHDLLALPVLCISILFASRRVGCTVELLNHSGGVRHYVVSAEVPAFSSTGWHSFTVALQLVMTGASGSTLPQAVEVGAFTYSSQPTQPIQARKRRASSCPDENALPPVKKTSTHKLPIQEQHAGSPSHNQNVTSPYSPFVHNPTTGPLFQSRHQQTASPRPFAHHYSTSAASVGSMKAPSPHTPSWSPSFTTVNGATRSPVQRPPMTPASRPATSSPTKPAAPTLIRTSTIQQSPGSIHTVSGGALSSQSFNPYAMYPLKASLKLNGDLDAMAEGWSLEEFDARRRLVQFTRKQTGSSIHADFKAIRPEDRPPNSITISCIWWEERKECYVTSVDTIFLLESLVAVRFTVEEKNRIRRNLEGFRPLTVSKSKADSEEFFKVIMGFPNPKPRNIEKDVKVFPWKIIAHALKKIISKYSASYSSTAGALLTPASSTYASTDASGEHLSVSPRITAVGTTASYPASTTTSYSPPLPQQRMSAPVASGPINDLPLHLPNMPTGYSIPSNYPFHPTQQVSQPQAMSAPVSRASGPWDYINFVNTSSATSGPGILTHFPYSQSASGVNSHTFMPATSYSGN